MPIGTGVAQTGAFQRAGRGDASVMSIRALTGPNGPRLPLSFERKGRNPLPSARAPIVGKSSTYARAGTSAPGCMGGASVCRLQSSPVVSRHTFSADLQARSLLGTTGRYTCASLIRKRSQVRVLDRPSSVSTDPCSQAARVRPRRDPAGQDRADRKATHIQTPHLLRRVTQSINTPAGVCDNLRNVVVGAPVPTSSSSEKA